MLYKQRLFHFRVHTSRPTRYLSVSDKLQSTYIYKHIFKYLINAPLSPKKVPSIDQSKVRHGFGLSMGCVGWVGSAKVIICVDIIKIRKIISAVYLYIL